MVCACVCVCVYVARARAGSNVAQPGGSPEPTYRLLKVNIAQRDMQPVDKAAALWHTVHGYVHMRDNKGRESMPRELLRGCHRQRRGCHRQRA